MAKPSPRESFRQIYRRQYQRPFSKFSQAIWIVTPAALLVIAVFAHSLIISIIIGAGAVLMLAGAIVLTLERRRSHPPSSG